MTEIEKARFAIKLTESLLSCGEKIKAISLILLLFNTGLRQAKEFVGEVQILSESIPPPTPNPEQVEGDKICPVRK